MEYALGDRKDIDNLNAEFGGLNPCCNGICSRSAVVKTVSISRQESLNPCCNGICSRSRQQKPNSNGVHSVLILVVMEYALGVQ